MVFVWNVCVCNRQLCVWETIVFARDNCVCERQLCMREAINFSWDSYILRRQLHSQKTVVFSWDSCFCGRQLHFCFTFYLSNLGGPLWPQILSWWRCISQPHSAGPQEKVGGYLSIPSPFSVNTSIFCLSLLLSGSLSFLCVEFWVRFVTKFLFFPNLAVIRFYLWMLSLYMRSH